MAIFAVLMPAAMLALLLALGRYEDVMLPAEAAGPDAPPSPEAETGATVDGDGAEAAQTAPPVILTGGASRGPMKGSETPGMFVAHP
jgi:hypothetical protein